MNTAARRPPGRPAVLSRAAVLEAAVAQIDAAGLGSCTMRAVADRLGVRAMSLYRHVGGKDAMLRLVPDHLLGSAAAAVVQTTAPLDALRAVAAGLENLIGAHPHVTPLLSRPDSGPGMTAAAQHCVQLLGAAGVDGEEAYGLVRAVVAQVIGEAVTSHGAVSRVGIDLIMEGLASRLGSR